MLLDEANERELRSEATVGVPSTWSLCQTIQLMGPGIARDLIYVLPQDEREGVLYLGIAGDEIPAGAFNNDGTLNLSAVNGPGNVLSRDGCLWQSDQVLRLADGIGSDDVFPVSVGGHVHQNWAFTAAGRYEVVFGPMGAGRQWSSRIE